MKNLIFIISIPIIFLIACSSITTISKRDYFEGIITYRNDYIIKTTKVDSVFLNKIFGKTAIQFFKEGNFIEKYDGGFMIEQLYLKNKNKTYIKKNENDTLFWFSCNETPQKILKFELNKNKEKVLGIQCDELKIQYANKVISYYYNTDTLNINPKWYKNFTSYNKNIISRKMKSIYLKYKIEYEDFIAIVTATTIKSQKIDNELFCIPKNKVLIQDLKN